MPGPREIVPLAASCPWSSWAPPDIQHCEANVCGWITTPANTWSNLAYLAAALWLWRRDRRFALAALAIGATSFAFHASFTAAGQVLDYLGMFGYLGLLLALSLERLGAASLPRSFAIVVTAGLLGFGALRAADAGVQWVIVSLAASALLAEGAVLIYKRRPAYAPMLAGLGLTTAGAVLWLLDYKRIVCDPDNHWFQAHAAWHLLTAAAMPFLSAFYASRASSAA